MTYGNIGDDGQFRIRLGNKQIFWLNSLFEVWAVYCYRSSFHFVYRGSLGTLPIGVTVECSTSIRCFECIRLRQSKWLRPVVYARANMSSLGASRPDVVAESVVGTMAVSR